jgi:hypothetical protein
MYSFGGKGVSRQMRNGQASVDAFYDLPSTLKTIGTAWATRTETKENAAFMKAQAGAPHNPAANHYDVKRLYDEVTIDSNTRNNRRLQSLDRKGSDSPTRCTFGAPYAAYRHVVVGSAAFLDAKPRGA